MNSAATALSVAVDVQPQVGPSLTTNKSEPTDATNSSAPHTSNDRPGVRRDAGITFEPISTNTMPIATLTRNAERQPKLSLKNPPTTGPNFKPSATAVPMMPRT